MQTIPFIPSEPFYTFDTVINGISVSIDVRWNSRDAAWYFDLIDENNVTIAHGLKIVLGSFIGRHVNHPLFRAGVIVAIDTSGSRTDAGLDDLGARVVVQHMTDHELAALVLA